MRIFVSYAFERRPLAERLAMALRSEGHDVFFDSSSLPRGQAYDGRIRDAVAQCDLFIFLISPESVEAGSYTLSELDMMVRQAPVPSDRVLAVMIGPVPIEHVPNYLRPLNILHPVGEVVADILLAVHEIATARRAVHHRRFLAGAAALTIVGASVAGVLLWPTSEPAVQTAVVLQQALSVFRSPDQNSEIIDHVKEGEDVTLDRSSDNPNWIGIRTRRSQGWAMVQDVVLKTPDKDAIALGQGYGFQGGFWKLFFTSPQPGGKPPNTFGIDVRFADAIGRTEKSLDIAVYELDSRLITDAIIAIHRRGKRVRVVTDQRSADEPRQTFRDLMAAGIGVISRTAGAGIMHNKFAIIDGQTVWTGSWNYTDSGTYANNDNAIVLDGIDIATRYQRVFDEMVNGHFGRRRSASATAGSPLNHGVRVLFSPEDAIMPELLSRVRTARGSILFMTFAFTDDGLAQSLAEAAKRIPVRGLFEKRIAQSASRRVLPTLCGPESRAEVRLDPNPRYLHHNVFVIDSEIVITGSLNFSRQAVTANDENLVIVPDAGLARRYEAEFNRLWPSAAPPDAVLCAER